MLGVQGLSGSKVDKCVVEVNLKEIFGWTKKTSLQSSISYEKARGNWKYTPLLGLEILRGDVRRAGQESQFRRLHDGITRSLLSIIWPRNHEEMAVMSSITLGYHTEPPTPSLNSEL